MLPDRRTRPGAPTAVDEFSLGVDGIESFVVPNDRFYRIDTALVVPQVAVDSWKLSIDGLVDNPMELTFQDLLDRPQIERHITLSCVSNPVGGDLVGNALWQGVRLADILDEAGLQEGAEQVVSRSVDGWTCGSPIEAIMDGRDAMLGDRDERRAAPGRPRLPGADRRARPVRLRVGDEVGDRHPPDPLGGLRRLLGAAWVVEARSGEDDGAHRHATLGCRRDGVVPIGGVAWAVHRGVEAVQVRIDEGEWRDAELGSVPVGRHLGPVGVPLGHERRRTRRTHRRGACDRRRREVQPEEPTAVAPDGAQGYHRISLDIS